MKIIFFGAKKYDKEYFEKYINEYDVEIKYTSANLSEETAKLAEGYDGICAFVNADLNEEVIDILHKCGIKLILMRCAGYNNVDVKRAKELGIMIMRVPSYSPEAVAEHALTLALAANRRIHKSYTRVKENDFSIGGLIGSTLSEKTAGIIGTGKIGSVMAKICHGIGMNVIAYDEYINENLKDILTYEESAEEVFKKSDLISLHCNLSENTVHLINEETIKMMKDGVILVNTSRGGLIKTEDLIKGIRDEKFGAVALDVYEEEDDFVFEDLSNAILETSVVARLLSFPNVLISSHQAFFTHEAMSEIAKTTLENAKAFMEGRAEYNV